MKSLSTLLVLIIIFFASTASLPPASAEERKVLVGVRFGPSFIPQDPLDDVDLSADTGPAVNLSFLYKVNQYLKIGPVIEYEYHALEDAGDAYILSLMPTMEIGPGRIGNLEPYGTLGLGIHVNDLYFDSIDEDFPTEAFAFRIGAGTDFYLTDWFALNTELAWKLNTGTIDPDSGDLDYNLSSFLLLVGARFAF